MPYSTSLRTGQCIVCGADANLHGNRTSSGTGQVIDCSACGDFEVSREAVDDFHLPFADAKKRALARYTIRKMQIAGARRLSLRSDFFESLQRRALPTPMEASDNLILWLVEKAEGSPGKNTILHYGDPRLLATLGTIAAEDVRWIVESLKAQNLIDGSGNEHDYGCKLTVKGWQRLEELKRAQIASRFAFFARQFDNRDLDAVFERCLYPAVKATGYELRMVTQRAGLVDAIIEDEIRRCRFLIADLSDDNAGAYWEAGFAEGLGKPVIYICCTSKNGGEKKTHFDANHRHTVRWNLTDLDKTAVELKAVIRNTLLGDAIQTD
jgi:hypothetical protein